jgi:hypothetical protein
MAARFLLLCVLGGTLMGGSLRAEASPIDQGKMMLGVVLGGGTGYFAFGGEVGYFVLDGLRPSLSVVYQTQTSRGLETSEVETTPGLRYYVGIPETSLYPFAEGELGINSLSYEIKGVASDSFLFYRAGVGGGLLYMLHRNFGLEVTLGVDQFFGADSILKNLGFIPDGLAFRYNFGFSVSF